MLDDFNLEHELEQEEVSIEPKEKVIEKYKPKKKETKPKKNKAIRTKKESAYKRNKKILELKTEGYSLTAIAQHMCLSRQRIHQILNEIKSQQEHVDLMELRGKDPDKFVKTESGTIARDRVEAVNARGKRLKLQQYRNPKTIGDRIVARRVRLKITLQQLGKATDLAYGTLSLYENNKCEPNADSLRRLSIALNCSAHWLIFGERFKKKRNGVNKKPD